MRTKWDEISQVPCIGLGPEIFKALMKQWHVDWSSRVGEMLGAGLLVMCWLSREHSRTSLSLALAPGSATHRLRLTLAVLEDTDREA